MARELQIAHMLVDFARVFVTDYSVHAVLERLCERAPEVLPVAGVAVMLRDDDDSLQVTTATDGRVAEISQRQPDLGEGPAFDVVARGLRVHDDDFATTQRWPRFSRRAAAAGLTAVHAFPLTVRDDVIGAVEFYRDRPGLLSGDNLEAAAVLADVATAYIVNARTVLELRRAQARLRHETLHDGLTGLPNRTLLMDRLRLALAKAERHPWNPTVLFCDLDNFKEVNDRFGHHAGDRLLVAVAGRLRGLLRPGDTLARIAGDEFVVLCEDMPAANEAVGVAERFSQALEEPFPLDDVTVRVRASIGIATATSPADRAEDLLRRADQAMYRAKQAGGARHERADGPD